jgi:hypothetical protein
MIDRAEDAGSGALFSVELPIEDFLAGAFVTKSWCCIDCGVNTHPGAPSRAEMEKAFAAGEVSLLATYGADSEVYAVRDAVWKAAGMAPESGCLCIRCLEQRLGRKLRPKDFPRDDVLNDPRLPGTALRAGRLRAGKPRQ